MGKILNKEVRLKIVKEALAGVKVGVLTLMNDRYGEISWQSSWMRMEAPPRVLQDVQLLARSVGLFLVQPHSCWLRMHRANRLCNRCAPGFQPPRLNTGGQDIYITLPAAKLRTIN